MSARESKKSAAESEDDKTETPSLNPKSMERLVTDFSKYIQTAMAVGVATATAAATAVITDHHSEATNTKYTSAIDQYNNQLFSVKTKEVKYQWGQVTKIRKGGTPISMTVANAEMILDLLKDRAT